MREKGSEEAKRKRQEGGERINTFPLTKAEMCSQGQSGVKRYLPLLANRPCIAQVTDAGQVCLRVSV